MKPGKPVTKYVPGREASGLFSGPLMRVAYSSSAGANRLPDLPHLRPRLFQVTRVVDDERGPTHLLFERQLRAQPRLGLGARQAVSSHQAGELHLARGADDDDGVHPAVDAV